MSSVTFAISISRGPLVRGFPAKPKETGKSESAVKIILQSHDCVFVAGVAAPENAHYHLNIFLFELMSFKTLVARYLRKVFFAGYRHTTRTKGLFARYFAISRVK